MGRENPDFRGVWGAVAIKDGKCQDDTAFQESSSRTVSKPFVMEISYDDADVEK